MRIGPQPRGRRGTVGHPYSPLNLRLVLAAFGLVTCTVFAALSLRAGVVVAGWLFIALALAAAVDLVVVQLRRRARRRADRNGHSLFE
jgi:Flp pilus assembly protein TadB